MSHARDKTKNTFLQIHKWKRFSNVFLSSKKKKITIFLNILFWDVRFSLQPSLSEQQTALSVGLQA